MVNNHIKHFIKNNRYLCIRCVEPTPEKATTDWAKVTCKNCLQRRETRASAKALRNKTMQIDYPQTQPDKLKLIEKDEEQMRLRDRLCYSAGYAKGMRDGIIGNYIIVGAGLILAIILVVVL